MAIHHVTNDPCPMDLIVRFLFTGNELKVFNRAMESFIVDNCGTLEDSNGSEWTLSGTDFFLDPETVRNEGWKCRPLMHFDFEGVVFDYIPLSYREAIDHLLGT